MDYFWSGLLGAIALVWSVLGLRMLRSMAGVPRLAGVVPLPDGECPMVSILFAARDEDEEKKAKHRAGGFSSLCSL